MVKLAKDMVKKGELGKIIKVVCEYPQGYAITALTGEEKAIANWRANPEIAGISNCMGDIGTHAENLSITSPVWKLINYVRIYLLIFLIVSSMMMAMC